MRKSKPEIAEVMEISRAAAPGNMRVGAIAGLISHSSVSSGFDFGFSEPLRPLRLCGECKAPR
jgi:hypothetical protein